MEYAGFRAKKMRFGSRTRFVFVNKALPGKEIIASKCAKFQTTLKHAHVVQDINNKEDYAFLNVKKAKLELVDNVYFLA